MFSLGTYLVFSNGYIKAMGFFFFLNKYCRIVMLFFHTSISGHMISVIK